MREHIALYEKWKKSNNLHLALKEEIMTLKKDSDLEDRFYKNLEFGTAGIRGLLGVGTNRMNVHTLASVIQALQLKMKAEGTSSVVIGYDTRRMSEEFCKLAASILSRNGISVSIFNEVCTTPLLSYSVIELKADYGIMITASHNPKEYNGCKIYGSDGTQIDESVAKEISDIRRTISDVLSISLEENYENVVVLNDGLYEKYINKVLDVSFSEINEKDISIVYTPLHGTGFKPISEILRRKGYFNVQYVEEQKNPSSEFETVVSPNPEEKSAFELAIKKGLTYNSDILIATDPDSDRVGVMVKHNGKYEYLSGNVIGTLLANFIIENNICRKELKENSKIIKTIVTSNLVDKIAENYGVTIVDVHVGFKNIYSKVNQWESEGDFGYLFGFEESLGFGIGSEIARDKDAILATSIIVEMASKYKSIGKSLLDVYLEIQEKYGYEYESLKSFTMEGKDGKEKMDELIRSIREKGLSHVDSLEVIKSIDYLPEGKDVLKFTLEDESWFAIRPSGTEPKLKIYSYAKGSTNEECYLKSQSIENFIVKEILKK